MVNSPTTRVTRSFRHRDMGSIQAAESPSFSIGVGDSNNRATTRRSRRNTSAVQANSPSTNTNNRRSTQRAAQTARTIIAQELAPQRRSNRLAASKPDNNTSNTSSSPAVRRNRNQPSRRIQASTNTATNSPTRRRTRTPKRSASPIDLCDSDSTVEDAMDLKPAAKTQSTITGASSLAVKPPPLEDITCPICLDTPSSMTQVAKISGCDHRFCFDCIDKWADTENKW